MTMWNSPKAGLSGALVAASLALAGCQSAPVAAPGLINPPVSAALGQSGFEAVSTTPSTYVLRRMDTISINVFREEGLSLEEVAIGADGRISMPLVGSIEAAGMTAEQLERRIEELLGSRFLREPHVAVNVAQYASHQVTVEGSVETPGLFEFRPGTRLSGGIALAEGITRVAAVEEVAVFRETPQGMTVAKFDYAAVQAGTMIDPVLMPGDRIVVGTDNLSQFWQDLLKALPVFALFTQI